MTQSVNNTLVFIGTSSFAVPALTALTKAGYPIVAVVTAPDEPAGRKRALTPSPVKTLAEKLRLPLHQPATLVPEHWKNEIPEADCYILASYGKIIPSPILLLPKRGVINIHPSLLPQWRGPAPIQYALLNGDKETGVSIMLLDELMDHGPILAVRKHRIGAGVAFPELHDALAELGATLLIDTLPDFFAGRVMPSPQHHDAATFSRMLNKDSGRINWSHPAEEIERMIRAYVPWPSAWTLWPTGKKIYRVRIETASVVHTAPSEGVPGYIWANHTHPMLIKTGTGSIAVKRLTLEGKPTMDADAFLRGYPQCIGSNFI